MGVFHGFFIIFPSEFSFTNTNDSQDRRGREGTIFYSTLPLPPAHKHWYIYLELCMWGDYQVFLIATLVFTRLLLDKIYYLIELSFDWLIDDAMFVCLLDELILGFCYSDLTLETGGFELASTITLVLQANWLTKCASHRFFNCTNDTKWRNALHVLQQLSFHCNFQKIAPIILSFMKNLPIWFLNPVKQLYCRKYINPRIFL